MKLGPLEVSVMQPANKLTNDIENQLLLAIKEERGHFPRRSFFGAEVSPEYYQACNEENISQELIDKVHDIDRRFANRLQESFGEAVTDLMVIEKDLLVNSHVFAANACVGNQNYRVSLTTYGYTRPDLSMVEMYPRGDLDEDTEPDRVGEFHSQHLELLEMMYCAAMVEIDNNTYKDD